MNQIGLGEDGATRGNPRALPATALRFSAQLLDSGQVEPSRLLVEEAAGTGSAGGIGGTAEVVSSAIEG